MRIKLVLCVLVMCSISSGCNLIVNSTRNLIFEPARVITECQERTRNRFLANEAWDEIRKHSPNVDYSKDYVKGFKAGFADYLYAGGTGTPPPLPPRHYWTVHYQTPEGFRAIEDWFAGFREGTAVAQQSGLRQELTIPTSLQPPNSSYRQAPLEEYSPEAPSHEAPLEMPRMLGAPTAAPSTDDGVEQPQSR